MIKEFKTKTGCIYSEDQDRITCGNALLSQMI